MANTLNSNDNSLLPPKLKERLLTCRICLEIYHDPKILPCYHTFCRSCLCNHVYNTSSPAHFRCPLCRTGIRMPEGGIDEFQGNFYIQEISELAKLAARNSNASSTSVCSPSSSKLDGSSPKFRGRSNPSLTSVRPPSNYNTDEGSKYKRNLNVSSASVMSLCSPKDSSLSSPKDTNNRGRSKSSSTSEMSLSSPTSHSDSKHRDRGDARDDMLCPTHAFRKEWVVCFCTRCRIPICLQCKKTDHSGHEFEDLGVAVDKAQRHMQRLGQEINSTRKYLKEMNDDRRAYMGNFCQQISKISEDIRTNTDIIKEKVTKRCDDLVMLLNHLKVTEASRVESHELQLRYCSDSLAEVQQGVDYILNGTGVLDLLASKRHLLEMANDVMKSLPGEMEKCTVVYDRMDLDVSESIEAGLGYISSYRERFEDYLGAL